MSFLYIIFYMRLIIVLWEINMSFTEMMIWDFVLNFAGEN